MSFGLALAGGGARGAAHAGVLLALEEAGLAPESIAGTSAGSIVAGLYAAGISPKELSSMMNQMAEHPRDFLDPDLHGMLRGVAQYIKNRPFDYDGLLKGDRLERFMKDKTQGISIKETKIPIVIPAVDLNTGLTVAFTNTLRKKLQMDRVQWKTEILLNEAMRASASYPAVFKPKYWNGMCLVDGGVTDILPVDLLISAGEPNVLAVDVSHAYQMPETHSLFEITAHSFSLMSYYLKECHSVGEKLLLKPVLPQDAGLLSLERMPECFQAGYESARKAMPEILKIFKK